MRKGIRSGLGFLIVLWGLSQFFTSSFSAFDNAVTASLQAIEAAAIKSQFELQS